MRIIFLVALTLISLNLELESKLITVLDNGIERKINIGDDTAFEATDVNSNREILIKFKSSVDVDDFAKRYGLVLKKKLSIGYYIFLNNSSTSSEELILEIIKRDRDLIKTVRPNYAFGNLAI
jgi:hypothetical protein